MRGNGRPSVVLFDLDGTLIDTKALYLEAFREAVRPYVREGMTREDIMGLKPTSELAFIQAVVAESDVEACLADFYTAYQRFHETSLPGLFDGIPEVLDAIRAAGVPLGMVTGKSRRAWEITSAAVAIGPFDVLVFDDDVRAPKPDPHGLEIALEALGADPAGGYYVGDNVSDARAARAAGLRPIAALWARPADERPAFVQRLDDADAVLAERPADLHRLLGLTDEAA